MRNGLYRMQGDKRVKLIIGMKNEKSGGKELIST